MRMSNGVMLSMLVVMVAFLPYCKEREQGAVLINPLATPEETVKAYCELDASGRRLSGVTWKETLPYIAWQDEPGWDSATVISGYKASKAVKLSETLSRVKVEYSVIGVCDKDFEPSNTTETVTFSVRKTVEGWKITSPDFMPPHVYAKPLIAHMESVNPELAHKVRKAVKSK